LNAKQLQIKQLLQLAGKDMPVDGILAMDVSLQGSQLNPTGNGSLQIAQAVAYEQPIQNIDLKFQATGDTVTSKLQVKMAPGNSNADIILHPKTVHLVPIVQALGAWLYLVLFLIIFCETGLVVTPFLPGDSLLFAVGALAASSNSALSLPLLLGLLIVAAILVGLIFTAALPFTFQSKMIECAISRQRQQPRDKWPALRVIRCGIAPKLQENVLDDFFRRGRLLQDAQDKRVNGARMAVVELLEGAHVLPKKALHQRRVARHFVRHGARPKTCPQICKECQEHRRFFVSYLDYVASGKADEPARRARRCG
jgi:hypothetical protein